MNKRELPLKGRTPPFPERLPEVGSSPEAEVNLRVRRLTPSLGSAYKRRSERLGVKPGRFDFELKPIREEDIHGQYEVGPEGGPPDDPPHRGQQVAPQRDAHLCPQGRGGNRLERPEGRGRGAGRGRTPSRPGGAEGHRAQERRIAENLALDQAGQGPRRLIASSEAALSLAPAEVKATGESGALLPTCGGASD